jgi:hypothetical protein
MKRFLYASGNHVRRVRVTAVRPLSSNNYQSPLDCIHAATVALHNASSDLSAIAATIHQPMVLKNKQMVTIQDIVLHSRDCPPQEFHSELARAARAQTLVAAQHVESQLQTLAQTYVQTILPSMQQATAQCQQFPCGGASLELTEFVPNTTIRIKGTETPCGKLQQANMLFLTRTFETKQAILLASRAALILRLTQEFNAPLSSVRQQARDRIGRAFAQQVVPTPWIRSGAEYKELFAIKDELAKQQNKHS